jgi:hypothetical protein
VVHALFGVTYYRGCENRRTIRFVFGGDASVDSLRMANYLDSNEELGTRGLY